MISQLVKLLNSFDVCANYSFFFFENTDVAVDFRVAKLVVLEVSQSSWNLVLALMIKENEERACVVVNLELSSHWLFNSPDQAACQYYVVDGVSFKLTNIIWTWLCVHYHSYSNRSKNL